MNTWHATLTELARYRSGGDDPVVAASVEAHLLRCAECRTALAGAGGAEAAADTERRWAALTEVVDRPARRPLARVGASTHPLRAAWVAAVLLVCAVPSVPLIASGNAMPTLLLALAPIAPGLAVALAYLPAADPSGEIALATPMAGLRVVAARALLVAAVAAPIGVLPALLLDVPLHLAAAWLLPGLALSSLVLLAGTTRFDPATVVAVLGTAWALAVATPGATRRMTAHAMVEQVASSETQVTAVAVAVVALALTCQRRQQVSYRRSA